jgi:hypothetical protein
MKFEVRQDRSRLGQQPEEMLELGEAAMLPDQSVPEEDAPEPYAEPEPEPQPLRRRWIAPTLAVLIAAVWIGALLWLARSALPVLDALVLASFAAALVTGPILVGVVYLIARRSSRAEARRFGVTAQAMRAEAASLERSIATLTATLAASREELNQQAHFLLEIGEAARDRMGQVAVTMADQVREVDGHARGLAESAAGAQASVGVLLASLPRAQAEVSEAARLLERTGLAAGEHASALDAQLVALAERGREADTVAGGAAQRLAAHIQRMEATGETAGVRLEAVTAQASAEVDALLERTAAAIDGSRRGIAAQGEAMLAMIAAHQAALDAAARDSADALGARIDGLEAAIDRLADRLGEQRRAGDALVDDLQGGLGQVEQRMDALHLQGVERSQLLAASISALGGSADAMTEALRTGEAMATRTIGTTESLLIALDSAAREIDETLPEALARLDDRIDRSRQVVGHAKPELLALVTAAESTHDAIEAIAGVIGEQRRVLDQLSAGLADTLGEGRARAEALGQVVDETIERTHRFAEEAAPRLVDALLRVRDTAAVAADKARDTLAAVIPHAADALEQAAAEALARASGDTVERQIVALVEATENAVAGTSRAVERLAGHLQAIADQTAIVDTRLEDVRAEREQAAHESFARRASLLVESLNSAAIDVTKSFAPEITDSAWAAYLKGDRGVFTRRAVRIIDGGVARDIARLYDSDGAFREAVNRYIHDFEAMLRGVLDQRDGSALGVTLLSSDMGKLYVALAQAIERLR